MKPWIRMVRISPVVNDDIVVSTKMAGILNST
jgi:hypothetical protein